MPGGENEVVRSLLARARLAQEGFDRADQETIDLAVIQRFRSQYR